MLECKLGFVSDWNQLRCLSSISALVGICSLKSSSYRFVSNASCISWRARMIRIKCKSSYEWRTNSVQSSSSLTQYSDSDSVTRSFNSQFKSLVQSSGNQIDARQGSSNFLQERSAWIRRNINSKFVFTRGRASCLLVPAWGSLNSLDGLTSRKLHMNFTFNSHSSNSMQSPCVWFCSKNMYAVLGQEEEERFVCASIVESIRRSIVVLDILVLNFIRALNTNGHRNRCWWAFARFLIRLKCDCNQFSMRAIFDKAIWDYLDIKRGDARRSVT